jgi:ParB-like chromosome segregation protein Spo0J
MRAKELRDWPATIRARKRIAELTPWPHNPRRHSTKQIESLARSLVEFGQTKTILIDDKNVILAGHGTVEAARKAGIDELEVSIARKWPLKKKRAYVIADNQLSNISEWDVDVLKSELTILKDEFDLETLGFDQKQLVSFLADNTQSAAVNQLGELTYAIVVTCKNEQDQRRLLKKFEQEGLLCRALIS